MDIYNPQILNDTEREYLKEVFRPFHDRIVDVIKNHGGMNTEFIVAELIGGINTCTLPYFEENKMYIGMESGHPYSLDELGITYTE